jgi:hypothetical protein
MKSFKQQCIELRKKDKTLNEIVAITGRSKSSVYAHIKEVELSAKKQAAIRRATITQAKNVAASRRGKALHPYTPFSDWNSDRVLLVSHLLFDGEILKQRCVYNNCSQALINRVTQLLCEVYPHPPKVYVVEKSGVTRIMIHNIELAAFLYEKAVQLLQSIDQLNLSFQREFLRAFFDDEGCMDFRPKTNHRRIRGYQNKRDILELVIQLLANFSIDSKIEEPNEVVITGKENLAQFQNEINFSAGVCINPNRTNSRWKKNLEKRELLQMAIDSYQS